MPWTSYCISSLMVCSWFLSHRRSFRATGIGTKAFVPYHKSTSEFCGSGGGEGKTSLSCLGERTSLCESFLLLGVQYSAQVGMVAGVGKCQNAFPVKQKYI